MDKKRGRVLISWRPGDLTFWPVMGLLDMERAGLFPPPPFRFRLAFAWLEWRISIGIGRPRYGS